MASKSKNKSKNANYVNRSQAELNAKLAILVKSGRKEITTKTELEKYPIGSLVSYMNKHKIYKSAGFTIKYAEDYFIYITTDFQTKYRVKYKNILKMWVRRADDTSTDLVSYANSTQNKTNFPIKAGNKIVYYAKNNYDKERFINTEKYKRLVEWYNYFGINYVRPKKTQNQHAVVS